MQSNLACAAKDPRLFSDTWLVVLSVLLQCALALFFGHLIDAGIFMGAGYSVATGHNPYSSTDLGLAFNNHRLGGLTTIGYPPLWALILGGIYTITYGLWPNLLFYNFAIKVLIIAANISLAYLAEGILLDLKADSDTARKAKIFLLFNPFILYASAAWGQIDSITALLSMWSLYLLSRNKNSRSALLLAVAISIKPTALPLVGVAFAWFIGKPAPKAMGYFIVFFIGITGACIFPFVIFHWDSSVILHNWNAHFIRYGCMSFLSFLELADGSFGLNGNFRFLGMLWAPALVVGTMFLRKGIADFEELLKKSAAMCLVFFLTRAWLSEPNILLILPMILMLVCLKSIDKTFLTAVWVFPFVISFFNASPALLFFPSMPKIMEKLLDYAKEYRTIRLIARTIIIIPWFIMGWRIVIRCFRFNPLSSQLPVEKLQRTAVP